MPGRLTKRRVDAFLVAADSAKDVCHFDGAVPGLALRLRAGRASWVYQYRHHGRTRRQTLGDHGALTLEQARDLARPMYAEVRAGNDPAENRRAERQRGTTFEEAAALYLADLKARAETGALRGRRSTVADFSGRLRSRILPALGRVPVADVDLGALERMHRSIADTPAQANRCLTIASAVLTFAERRGLRPLGSNPSKHVSRFNEKPKAERFTLEELQKLGAAMAKAEAEGESASAILAVRTLVLSGCRRSEVLAHSLRERRPDTGGGLRWADVDLADRSMLLRDAKSGDRRALLGSAVVSLLAAARPAGAADSAPVCPGARAGAPLTNLEKPWARLLARASLKPRGLHALRRTFASVAADLGLGEYLIGALLGHSRQGVTGRYVIPANDPLRDAAARVSTTIADALGLGSREAGRLLPFGPSRRL